MKKLFFLLFLLFAARAEATTWYFGQGAGDSDSNNCTQAQTDSPGNRKATPQGALACVGYSAGAGANHIVEGRAGTYQQTTPVGGHATDEFPSGTSWSAPFIFRARSGETVTLKANGAERNLWISNGADMYAIIQGFVFDGTNLTNDQFRIGTSSTTARFVRLINNEFINTEMENAIYIGAPQAGLDDGIEILNNRIHGGAFFTTANNAGRNHAMYLTGRGTLIEGNEIYNVTGYGIHIFCSGQGSTACSNNVVRKNKVYNYGTDTPTVTGIVALPEAGGGGNEIYNNQVFKAAGRTNDGAICIGITGTGSKVYQNTCHSVTWMGINYSGSGHEIKNNIVDGIPSPADQITGSGATLANNLCGSAHANCALNGDPLFVNTATDDYRLQTGSPAKNTGETLGPPYNVDYADVSRPQGVAPDDLYDIGAFEFTVVPVPSRRRIAISY